MDNERMPSGRRFVLVIALLSLFATSHLHAHGKGLVTLNFVNADIEAVTKAIGEMTGRTFVVDPRVKGTLQITSPRPVPVATAYEIVLAALRMQGYAAVQSDGVVRIVPEADAKFYAPPISGRERRRVAGEMQTRVFMLRHESSSQLLQALRPLVGANSAMNADAGSNTLIVTDYADNLERLARIIENLDQPRADEPVLISLKYAAAQDVASLIARLYPQNHTTQGAELDRLDVAVDSRSNSLILRGRDRGRVSRVQNMVAQLDQPTPVAGNVHVIYLKNADAVTLAETLRRIFSADPTPLQPAPNQSSAATPSGLGASKVGPTPSSVESFSPGMVQADPASNALIITAPTAIVNNLRTVVEKLDVRRAQVLVEALIAEISADKAAEFGIQWFNATGATANTQSPQFFGGFGTSTSANIAAIAANPVGAAKGLNIGIVKGQIHLPNAGTILNLGMLARALETHTGANILSTPTLLTLDNEEARITVGSNVPFLTGQYSVTGSTSTANPFQTFERRDVGLTLKVKPQITEGGTVRLRIEQEVSKLRQAADPTLSATDKRTIESTVLVDDGQIVVLGGLIEEQLRELEDKVPLLGDMPLLGRLFRYDTRQHVKTNLMVFLRPVIVRDAETAATVTHPRYDHILASQRASQPMQKPPLPNVSAPMLKYELELVTSPAGRK